MVKAFRYLLSGVVVLLTAFFGVSRVTAQINSWRWQNPVPVGNVLHAVQMVSLDTIYVCGENGNFMRSSDGGATWDIQANVLKLKSSLNAFSFLNTRIGMCCGDSGVAIKTTDGGGTWTQLFTNLQSKLVGIVLVDTNIAMMISHIGEILRTTDGGKSWSLIPLEGSRQFFSIRMLHPNFITITGYAGLLLESTDKGISWNQVTTNIGNTFFSSNFTDEMHGTLIGEYGIILHTSDGGASWVQQRLTDSSVITASLNDVGGNDPKVLGIVGDFGTLIYTTDGGVAWKQVYIGTRESIKGVSFFDTLHATAVGGSGMVLSTSDGGASWSFLPHIPFTEILHSVAFPKGDTSVGLAVGNSGTILRTSDGGKSWALSPSGTNKLLYSVCFADDVTAVATGQYGIILRSTDAGLSWVAQHSETSHDLYGVSFSTRLRGIAVGDSGTILMTSSGGQYWTYATSTHEASGEYNISVSYPDSLHAFLCSSESIYRSSDGGISWLVCPGAISTRGQTISFADSLHGGYVYSDKWNVGFTRCTSDGGNTFDSVYPSVAGKALRGICFTDRARVTVVGAVGGIYHSTDCGKTWKAQPSNTLNDLNSVSFGTLRAGTAVGYRGNIMRITTNEINSVGPSTVADFGGITIENISPNPTSGSAAIKYRLSEPGQTKVAIYSMSGNQILLLRNGIEEAGYHSLSVETSGLSSGEYFCHISSGSSVANAKLVVRR